MISVKCPHCHVGLKVDEKKIPEGIASFKCPKCKEEIPVSVLEKKSKNSSVAEDNTAIFQSVRKGNGKLTVIENADTPAQTFLLQEGLYIVGRKVSVSKANICIKTEDKLMSRSHIRIEVKRSPQGGLVHSLSDNNSKNRTLYNGKYLDEGEVIVLKNDDEIILGHTVLRFNE
ncbi:MAG: FHA domain-containing protein [Tannerella sp.]|jgi:DNA-directed RNA polymerase subunit M/transcription elongation factor TFIIS|nr:FHA domain-containing protein [Tannerella sp.]